MPFCSLCGKPPTKGPKRTIDPATKVCSECAAKQQQSAESNGMNDYYDEFRSNEQNDEDDDTDPLSEEMLEKSMSELTVRDIININMHCNKPITKKLGGFMEQVNEKISKMDKQIELLEAENAKKEEDNATLKETIRNMQRSINKIDSGVRDKNIIITSLPEGNVTIQNQAINSDIDKVQWLLKYMKNTKFPDEKIKNFKISRIGDPKEGYNRVMKIVLQSIDDRNNFLENTKTLKDAPDPFSKVYIKKDQHHTYVAENNRIRKKMKVLKSNPDNKDKDIKIIKGKLCVDGQKVDENIFFH